MTLNRWVWFSALLTRQSLAAILRVMTLTEAAKVKTHGLDKFETLLNSLLEFITAGEIVRF